MVIVLSVVAALLACGLGASVVLYHRELGRYEAFLRNRPLSSNALLTVRTPLPGCTGLAASVNAQLYASQRQALQMRQDEADLIAGLSGLSHDIRTPLAGARGYLQLARGEADPVERSQCLSLAEARLDAMQGLLDQLFDYARTSSMPISEGLEETDATALLASVLVGHHPSFLERGWEPACDLGEEPLVVSTDPEALRRIFENIVSNMIKHGSGDARIKRQGATLSFSNALVPDDPVDAALVFDRFYRSDPSRSGAGAGLGLPVARNACELLGIAVTARIEEERFILSLELPR